ncbi:MAG: glycine cleavage system aminomethyltransferase GcvT [Desulfobacterales bacterium]
MGELSRTIFYDRHVSLGAKMVAFGGWEMPIQYPSGIVAEHLATRKGAGLFDVSHMGRFIVRGKRALDFLQYALTNNAAVLDPNAIGAQYTILANEAGGAIDDAYLYRFTDDEYLLVVNASNRQKDWEHLASLLKAFDDVELTDSTEAISMISFQGPLSRGLLEKIVQAGKLPEPIRNSVSCVEVGGAPVNVACTGYTGEAFCFEIFAPQETGLALWGQLLTGGATPVGLGARDTLRLEACLPLYGHEWGEDIEGKEIPVAAVSLARFAVSFSSLKGDYHGREALTRQFAALTRIGDGNYADTDVLPRMLRPIALTGRGIARAGAKVLRNDRPIGFVTSGTMVPYWVSEGEGQSYIQTNQHRLRPICLAYLDHDIVEDAAVTIEIRGRPIAAVVVPHHMQRGAGPFSRPWGPM